MSLSTLAADWLSGTNATGRRMGSSSARFVPGDGAEQVLCVEDADDVVDGVPVNRVTRVGSLGHLPEHLVHGGRDGERRGLGARDHHVAGRDVAEIEHVADHLGLVVIERAGHLAFGDDELHLGLGDGWRGIRVLLGDDRTHPLTEPERCPRKRRHDELDRPEHLQKEGSGSLGNATDECLEDLGRHRIGEHRNEGSRGRHPVAESHGQVPADEDGRHGDADCAKHEPARLDERAVVDVALELPTSRPFQTVSQRGASRSG